MRDIYRDILKGASKGRQKVTLTQSVRRGQHLSLSWNLFGAFSGEKMERCRGMGREF